MSTLENTKEPIGWLVTVHRVVRSKETEQAYIGKGQDMSRENVVVEKTSEFEVYKQRVDQLDIQELVAVVNDCKLGAPVENVILKELQNETQE